MTKFFNLLISFWRALLALLDSYTFDLFGFDVSLLGIIVAFGIIALCCSVFWKGARA